MTRKVLMVFALLCAVVQGVWAWDGSGTQADPYQISSVDDWNALATAVEGGESYSGTYFKLTNNIDKVETMVGSSKDKAFRGHFYGNGKTLKVSYVPSEPYAAPFRYINGAKWSWIGTFRAFFRAKESLGVDTFNSMFTFTGAGEDDETGEIEEFPVINFEGDIVDDEATGISPVIRTIEADGSNRYFDLQGRQLDSKPTTKGIYINNGKKIIK